MFGRGFGYPEILLILGVLLLLFGAKKLPTMGSSLGRSFREIKRGITGESSSDSSDTSKPTLKGDVESNSRH